MPLAIIEAMSYGLPVITNNIGAVNELITNGKDGFISKNDEDYLDKIKLLLTNNKLRAILGNNARIKSIKNFDINRISERYVKLYKIHIK